MNDYFVALIAILIYGLPGFIIATLYGQWYRPHIWKVYIAFYIWPIVGCWLLYKEFRDRNAEPYYTQAISQSFGGWGLRNLNEDGNWEPWIGKFGVDDDGEEYAIGFDGSDPEADGLVFRVNSKPHEVIWPAEYLNKIELDTSPPSKED